MERRKTREVKVGSIIIGGTADIPVQSMTNIPAHDFEGTVAQLLRLQKAGCDIARIAVPEESVAEVFGYAKKNGVTMPLVADIHFDYKIALAALRCGADKIRINPGNIGESWKVREVADACKAQGVPIRIGVNGGSLEKSLLEKYGSPTAEAIAESALTQADVLEGMGFSDIVVSIKSSDVQKMVRASEIVAENSTYPIHLGVTEAGDVYSGLVKNAAGIGSLLTHGIGDTIRVSLTADPVDEIRAGREILRAVGRWNRGGINIISCPTCGRTKVDLISLVGKLREAVADVDTKGKSLNVAVMGCVVNGPGEAREADFGVAGGDGFGVFFRRGVPEGRVEEADIVPTLLKYIDEFIEA
ncbi:MAG: flavodoxin-dependent (E)-4-hydroxy-3-methylbut-2-enyl-diphosphate synthase [Clostridia bacterium]|nr:flavodoxin-dependent (E)-4-hydroxy-3-methylbut-2-enyl-diphosphate synthase [Clostridia bacterium]